MLIEEVRVVNPDAIVIVRTHHFGDALKLYKEGASYVLTPHYLGGEYIAKMIRQDKVDEKKYLEEKKKHMEALSEMLKRGHKHPEIERN